MSNLSPVVCELNKSALSEVMRIDAEVSRVPWSKALFLAEFDGVVGRILGVRVSGSLIGFLSCQIVEDECHILNIAVQQEFQKRGIGQGLLYESLMRFYREGVRKAFLEVRPSNIGARRLYDKAGFFETGIRERYYTDNGENAVLMEVDLQHFKDGALKGRAE